MPTIQEIQKIVEVFFWGGKGNQSRAQSVSHQKSDMLNLRRSLFREDLSQMGHSPINTGKCVRVRGLGHQ